MSSPTQSSGSLVNFTITSNGAAIASAIQVLAIDIWAALGEAPRARIAVFDGAPSDQDFPISSSATFAPGASISIAMGYDMEAKAVFSGTVLAQRIEIDEQSGSRLIVEAAAKDVAALPGKVPPPVLTVTFGQDILDLKAQTRQVGTAQSSGEVRFQGSSLAVPGATMVLAGLGSRFNGTATVAAVHQHIGDGQWTTTADYVLPAADAVTPTATAKSTGPFDPVSRTLAITTPNGNSIRLDDAANVIEIRDAMGNSAELGPRGVTIESKSNLTIAAAGVLTLKAALININ